MANYDSVLSELLINALMRLYHTDNEDAAYRLLFSRFCIENVERYKPRGVAAWDWRMERAAFLVSELNLPMVGGQLRFEDASITLHRSKENSLANILDDWHFQYADRLTSNRRGRRVRKMDWIDSDLEDILSAAKKAIRIKKKDPAYYPVLKNECLESLRRRYDVAPPEPIGRIDGFMYGENHNDFAITLDEKYSRLVHAQLFDGGKLTESELEHFLMQNLHLVEDGMTLVSNQYVIENGRLDILARDASGTHCVLELKVEDDPGLVFQVIYYRMVMEEYLRASPLRMIAIAPSFPPHLLKVFRTIHGLELFTFDAQMQNGTLKSLTLHKVKEKP